MTVCLWEEVFHRVATVSWHLESSDLFQPEAQAAFLRFSSVQDIETFKLKQKGSMVL